MEERTSFYITLLYKDFLAYVEKTLKKMGLDYEQLPCLPLFCLLRFHRRLANIMRFLFILRCRDFFRLYLL